MAKDEDVARLKAMFDEKKPLERRLTNDQKALLSHYDHMKPAVRKLLLKIAAAMDPTARPPGRPEVTFARRATDKARKRR